MRIIAGPCQHESYEQSLTIARECQRVCNNHNVEFIFKASFDKANRSSDNSKRGVGIDQTLQDFRKIKSTFPSFKMLTDVHEKEHVNIIQTVYFDVIDVIQIPYNIIQNEFSDLELLTLKKKFKFLEIHARSIFHQGLLLKKINKNKNQKFKKLMNEQSKILDQLYNICKKNNCSSLDLCLSYVLKKKFIDKIVIGVDNSNELSHILNYRKVKNMKFNKIIYNKSILDPISWLKLKY